MLSVVYAYVAIAVALLAAVVALPVVGWLHREALRDRRSVRQLAVGNGRSIVAASAVRLSRLRLVSTAGQVGVVGLLLWLVASRRASVAEIPVVTTTLIGLYGVVVAVTTAGSLLTVRDRRRLLEHTRTVPDAGVPPEEPAP